MVLLDALGGHAGVREVGEGGVAERRDAGGGAQSSRLPAIHLSSTVETSTAASAVTAATRAAPRRGLRGARARNILRSPALAPAAARADAARGGVRAGDRHGSSADGAPGGVFGTSRRARVAGTSPAARGVARVGGRVVERGEAEGLIHSPRSGRRVRFQARGPGSRPEPGSNFPFERATRFRLRIVGFKIRSTEGR